MRNATWSSTDTFDGLIPKLIEARDRTGEFYERFDYRWTLDKASYEYQDEVMYQHLVLTALKGIWHITPDNALNNPLFNNVCVRKIVRSGITRNSPARLKQPHDGWFFLLTTYDWFEFSALAIDGFCMSVNEPLKIDSFERRQHIADPTVLKPLWDVLLIKGLLGFCTCHEVLKPPLEAILAEKLGTSPHRTAIAEPNRPTDRLNEFSIRFTMAHEVAHQLESLFVDAGSGDPELLADTLALHGVASQNWVELNDTFAPMLVDASLVPVIAGQAFYFVLGMWITTENIVGEQFGESSDTRLHRITNYNQRLSHWRRALNQSDLTVGPHQDAFSIALLDHVLAFERYSKEVLSEMVVHFKNIDRAMVTDHPETTSIDGLQLFIQEQLKHLPK